MSGAAAVEPDELCKLGSWNGLRGLQRAPHVHVRAVPGEEPASRPRPPTPPFPAGPALRPVPCARPRGLT
jgi:hypothetical protein